METEKTNKTEMLRRVLSFLLCCAMVFSCVPAEASAETGGFCGENMTWTLTDDGVLTISGSGQMKDYGYNDAPWHRTHAAITGVVIQEGVTSIGNCAFYECREVSSISIPEGVTSIGHNAFSGCSSLSSISLPAGVTSIESDTFFGCSSLSSISLPAGVISIGSGAFAGCSSLSSISLPAEVASIGEHAFYGCSSLSSVSLPAGVSSIGDYAFSDCRKLACVTFTGAVPSISDSAFSRVTAAALYPGDDATWTTDKRLDYRGTLTWTASAEHVHDYTPEITAPTCTEQGYTTYTCFCGDNYVDECIDPLGHQRTALPGTPATCTESGATDGEVCSVCGLITVESEIIDALGHTEKTLPGREATCTRTGLTGGKQCSVCGEILEEQQVIPMKAHQEQTLPGLSLIHI